MLRLHVVRRVVSSVAAATVFVAVSGVGVAHAGPGQFDVVGPSGSGTFGQQVVVLANGNVVVTDPGFDLDVSHTDVGAVYLYDGVTHQVISTLTGSTTDDNVGGGFNGVVALSNGNYVVTSTNWDVDGTHTDVGAVTWGNGLTGTSGVVSPSNSLTGSTTGDNVGAGRWPAFSGVYALSNGNYVVASPSWDQDGGPTDVGAATWGNGLTGTSGVVSSSNSLIGSTTDDTVGGGGFNGVVALSNGNYVVASPLWDQDGGPTDVGAATWGNGLTGTSGVVSSSNSLTGSTTNDTVGYKAVVALSNGNYVVPSALWDLDGSHTDVGAVTWGNGLTGSTGAVSTLNSLTGSTTDDNVGGGGGVNEVVALSNGNYVVPSPLWDLDGGPTDVGAVTWGNGSTGTSGVVSPSNSLTGSTTGDNVGGGYYKAVVALSNGNYVVASPLWDLDGGPTDVGAVTWGNGLTGTSGVVSSSNSLIGSTTGDNVGGGGGGGGVVALSNGNYVVSSPTWDLDGGPTDVGAVTWSNGLTGTSGVVSSSNSLIGSTTNDTVGGGGGGCVCGVVALSNGNYVVASPLWERVGGPTDAGAVTWGNGLTGSTGAVSTLNSLTGSATYDTVGGGGVVALSNGNYVVSSPLWDLDGGPTDVGAVTWGNGLTGTSGVVSSSNSLIGSTSYDTVGGGGFNGVVSLSNGNYVVCSPLWDLDGSHTNVGAITLGNGLTGSTGPVTALNSVLGTTSGGGGWGLVYGFDYVHYQLVVGRPGDNTVTWMTVPVLPPTGANTNAFVAAALVFLAVGTVLVATRRRGPRAI